jgi:hypothetical protein
MRLLAVVLLAMFAAPHASAQILTSPPGGGIIPNYDLIRIGQTEALESGAVVARARGPLANVYNPAGLASSASTEINASSTGFQLTSLGLKGVGPDVSSSRIVNLGGFLGVVIADPVLKTTKWRLGFSIFSPIGWEPGTLSGVKAGALSGQAVTLDYRTQVRLRAQIPSLAAGVNVSRKFRAGVGLQVPIVSILQQQQSTSLTSDATDASSLTRTFEVDGNVWLVRMIAGLQWDVIPAVSLGLTAETGSVRLWGSSFYGDQLTTASGNGFETLSFRDPSARMNYKLPFSLKAGAAGRIGKVEFEANVRWYSSIGRYDLYRSDSVGTALSQMDGGAPVITPVLLTPVTLTYRSVVNLAAGMRVPLTGNWQLHVGLNSDQSPLPGPNEFFRSVTFVGGTAGLSFAVGSLSGAVGLGFQTGASPTSTISVPAGTVDINLTVKTFQLLYSLAYTF